MAQSNQLNPKSIDRSENISVKPLLRKRLQSSRSHKTESKHPSSAFVLKCAKEQENLRSKIADQLRCHLLDLFDSERFADTSIINGKLVKKVHSSLLITRIPNLYNKLLNFNRTKSQSKSQQSADYCLEIPFEINKTQLISFLQKVYSEEDIKKEEIDLIRKLENFLEQSHEQKIDSDLKMEDIIQNSEQKESSTLDDDHEQILDNISDIEEDDYLKGNSAHDSEQPRNANNGKSERSSRRCFDEDSKIEPIGSESDQNCKEEENVSQDFNFETNKMVRSGTFELLSAISSENNCDLKDTVEDNFCQKDHKNVISDLPSKESSDKDECNQSNLGNNEDSKSICDSPSKLKSKCETKPSNSMFSLFIDMKSIPEQKSFDRTQVNKENGLKFIPLKYSPTDNNLMRPNDSVSKSEPNCENNFCKPKNQSINSTMSSHELNRNNLTEKTKSNSLIRSLDSVLAGGVLSDKNIERVDDIPLLPMSPIFRRKALPKHNMNNKTDFETNGLPANSGISLIKPSTDPQDLSALTFHRRSSTPSNLVTDKDGSLSARNSLINFCQINTKTESSSVPKHSICESESKHEFFDEDSESLYSEVSEVSSSFNINSKNKMDVSSDTDLNDSLINRTLKSCSKLGEDLLRMFVEQINTDITIKVNDKEIKAHKCIIASRCQYFEAMLRGNWRESDSNYITLKGFSFESVHFALCHLYSGAVTIPIDKIDLSELALLSDLLAMDSLKEIVIYELKMNYCHFFHNPCDDKCIAGVVDCLSLCSECGLKDLLDKCLNWIDKYFSRVWSNKAFVSLSPQLMESCYRTKVNHLSPDNVLKTTLDCEKLITSLPRVKWAEPVFSLLAKLIEECCNFIAANYDLVITSNVFISLGRGHSWNISNLEETLLASMTKLTADVSCKSHLQLNNILLLQNDDETGFGYGPFNEEFIRLVTKMQRYCERYMIQNANFVVHCESWSLLSSESQQRIKDAAVLVFEFEKATAPPPKLTSSINTKASAKKSSEKTNIETCRDKSKGAITKKVTNSRLKNSGISAKKSTDKSEEHIYDMVPYEKVPNSQNKSDKRQNKTDNSTNRFSRQQELTRRKSQEKIAKVLPFTIKTFVSDQKNSFDSKNTDQANVSDLVAEIDAESNLVTYCLQEAELLEQELTRKLQKNKTSIGEKASNTTSNVFRHSKSINSRTTNCKTEGPSTSRVSSGSLRTNHTRSKNK